MAKWCGLSDGVLLAIAVVFSCWVFSKFFTGPDLSLIPRAGKGPGFCGLGAAEAKRDFHVNGSKIINEAYRKYKRSAFVIQTLNTERIVLSPRYIEEISKNVPDASFSVADGLREVPDTKTNLDVVFASSLHIDVCKTQLSQNLHRLIAPLNDEASFWLSQRIPGRVELKAYHTMVRVISATASRMLGGTAVSRNQEWLETAAAYSMDVVSVAMKLRPYPAALRPLIFPWLRGSKILDHHLRTTKMVFSPMFAQRLALQSSEKQDDHEKPADMIQWMVDSASGTDRDPDVLAHNMLFMSMAAVHTSSATAIHALFDLCANPEYMEPLRDEAQGAIKEHGWTLAAINTMKKLDSFMKESQRLNQAVLMTFNRRVVKTVQLSDVTLPAGSYITMPSDAVARDPEIYTDPETFDGFRFYDRRMSSRADANRHQFATTGPENLAFGYGKTACPGRFFATAQIKVVLANILLNYDISFPTGQTSRPANVRKGGLVRPDPRQSLVFAPRNSIEDNAGSISKANK
ncbi:Ent-kaurene oxidase-like protein [Purpureocillium lavendulum]|uniref:Ent-kaurene oxidase-like protein n=1 Tax=Purpureocillium lavendulum TaxID=1247861 RepID=A0AB34FIF0_9HYPO|nr:Ent-kaurene oxidase-like protein [Purpureocillium lavendulum]